MTFLNLLTLAVGDILPFSIQTLNNFISDMLETTASINTDFLKELIRIKKQKIAVNNTVTDVL